VLFTQAGHRLLFGLLTLMTLLLYRNHYATGDPGKSIVGLIPVAAAAAGGSLLAAVITPPLVRRLGAPRWLVALTAVVGVLVLLFGVPFLPALTVVGSFVVSLGAQGTKIITDTTLQLESDDDFRGRVFSVNDTGFNLLFVIGLLIGSAVLPTSGVSVLVLLGAAAGYGLVAAAYATASRRIARRIPPVPVPPEPEAVPTPH
jgi:MFS family permease